MLSHNEVDPQQIESVESLEDLLSEPTSAAIDAMNQLGGDLMLLGVGGKMGLTLARMARRACDAAGVTHRIIGVSRFSNAQARDQLEALGIDTIACDLLDAERVAELPQTPNIIYMPALKFGAGSRPDLAWAMNAYLPGLVTRHFRDSRFAAFSTGNVYRMVAPETGGCDEAGPLDPIGEYAMSCFGRERMFQYASHTYDMPVAIIRLNYATEMRYGVLVDIARQVWTNQPVDITTSHANVIWQADANAMTLAALTAADKPPFVVNLAGETIFRVRDVAGQMADIMGREVTFIGEESGRCLLSDGSMARKRFGASRVELDQLIRWTTDWVMRDAPSLNKPTHFQTRDGKF